MKKKDLVSEIEKLKGKVIVDNNIKNLCDQVSRLTESLAKRIESNEKLSSQFIVVKKVNTLLEECVTELEKSQAKTEQYSRRYNVEISDISHEILDNNIEDKVMDIYKDAGIEIGHMDIEGCHRLPLSRNNAGGTKRVIVKFVNRKQSSQSVRYLGIVIDQNLNSKDLINNFAVKLNRANVLLFEIRNFVSITILKTICFAIFDSHINYASLVWAQNSNALSRILTLQKKAIRIITFQSRNCHSSPLFSKLKLP